MAVFVFVSEALCGFDPIKSTEKWNTWLSLSSLACALADAYSSICEQKQFLFLFVSSVDGILRCNQNETKKKRIAVSLCRWPFEPRQIVVTVHNNQTGWCRTYHFHWIRAIDIQTSCDLKHRHKNTHTLTLVRKNRETERRVLDSQKRSYPHTHIHSPLTATTIKIDYDSIYSLKI